MSGEYNNAVKVGLFSIVGLAILIFLVFSISDVKLFTKTYQFYVSFSFANGVGSSSPVRLAGVDVGEVKDIKVNFSPQDKKNEVLILVEVNENAKVPRDSQVWINTLGLLGEKYIEIIPGEDYQDLVKPGEVVKGDDPIPIQELTRTAESIIEEFEKAVKGINTVILNEQTKERFDSIMQNLQDTTSSLDQIMEKINSGQGTAGKFLTDERLYTDTKEMIADIKQHPWKLLRKPQE